jgi:hypothetical protein
LRSPSSSVAILEEYFTFATIIFSANYFDIYAAISKGDVSKLTPYLILPSGIVTFIG